jgi:hypothetical protein
MPVIFVHKRDNSGEGIKKLLGENNFTAAGSGDADYIKAADALIKAAGQDYGTAAFESINRSGEYTDVLYKNIVNNTTVEKSYIICSFEKDALSGVESEWLSAVRVNNKTQKTISAAEALLLFMSQNKILADIHIDSIEMVYWLDESVPLPMPVFEDTALPVWKISFNGGDYNYIDAFEHN